MQSIDPAVVGDPPGGLRGSTNVYIPAPFRVDDRAAIAAFMQRFDFAAVVTHSGAAGLVASHIPILVREVGQDLQIVGHLARGNPHWKSFDGQSESMVIFQGPHGYISPTWYATTAPAVPTWNYAVVHAYGAPRVREDAAFIASVVEDLTRRYEGPREPGWSPEALPPDTYRKLLAAIVGFEMTVVRCQANFKLGQNRSAADRSGAVAGLEREQTSAASELARFMTEHTDTSKPRDP